VHAQVVTSVNGYPQQFAMHPGIMQPGMMPPDMMQPGMMQATPPQPTAAPVGVGQPYFGDTTQSCGDCGTNCGTACRPCVDCCKYLKGFGGGVQLGDYQATDGIFIYEGEFSDGFLAGGALGRKIMPFLNMEAEFCYRTNDGDEVSVYDLQGQQLFEEPWEGDIQVYSGMTNYLLEGCRRIGHCGIYGGAGAGYAFVDGELTSTAFSVDIDDSGFAYQFIAGISRAIGCRADVFAEYRYFAVEDLCAEHDFQTNTAPPVQGEGTMDAFDYRTHNVLFGLRLCF
jgi:opacity protein-like surface antigen